MFFSMPGIRQITFSLFCIWILGKLTELSGLFRTSHIVFGPEDAYSLNAGHRERIREAIRQGRFHPVTKGKQKDDDSTDHSRFNKDDATDHFQALPRLGSRVRPHKNSLDLLLPKPVIVVGFPKAGTSSIFAFFRQQQGILKCQHWYCCADQSHAQTGGPAQMAGCMLQNIVNNRSIFEECGDFDVYAEINGPRSIIRKKLRRKHINMSNETGVLQDDGTADLKSYDPLTDSSTRIFFPQYFNLDDMHESYPNATFILNTRPFESWIKSVQSWGVGLDWQFVNEFYHRGELDSLPNDKTNKTEMANIMRQIYDRHHERVKQFVIDHPSHTLIELPILDPNAGDILGKAFGLDATQWGRYNENSINSFASLDKLFLEFHKNISSMAFFVFVGLSVFALLLSLVLLCLFVICFQKRQYYCCTNGNRKRGTRSASLTFR